MSQGITTPASDGLWSLLSYWRKAKSQLDWEIPTYMSVHGNVQPVMGKSKCGGSEDTWTLQLECCADEGVICHLSSTVGKDSGKLLRHESSIIYRDGEANLCKCWVPSAPTTSIQAGTTCQTPTHLPSRYLVPSVQKDKHGDLTQPLPSHRVGMGSHLQSRHSQEAQWHQSPTKQVKTRNLGSRSPECFREGPNTLVKSLIQQGTPLPEGGIEVGITVPVVYLSHGKGEEFNF